MDARIKGWIAFAVLLGVIGYALAEDLTLTTYYPSPRGVYQELRASGNVAIGTTTPLTGAGLPPRLYVLGSGSNTTLRIDNTTGPSASPVVVNSSGEVAIGTTDPGGYKLRVQGGSVRFGTTTTDAFTFTSGQVGIGTTALTASSVLELVSTTKGVLLPRMTEEQRDAVSPRVEGLMIYNTGTHQLNVYNGSAWVSAGGNSSSGQRIFNTPGQFAFVVPNGVTTLNIELWGAGGGGGGSVQCPGRGGGGGGGGGGYAGGQLSVTPNITYWVTVGAGGGGGQSSGTCVGVHSGGAGGGASFIERVSGTYLMSANGGNGGQRGWDGGAGGAGGTASGPTAITGANGGNGAYSSFGCDIVGGTGGGSPNGGATTAIACDLDPFIGNYSGGGGSGDGNVFGYGGAGANGMVVISW